MTDELPANPADAGTPAPAEAVTTDDPLLDALNAPSTEEPTAEEEETEEIEYGGKKYRVAKPLKDGFLMHSDYTRKTQELAAQRTAHEGTVGQFRETMEHFQKHAAEVGKLGFMSEQLAEFDKVNWDQLSAQNKEQAEALWRQRTLLKEHRDQLGQKLANDWQQTQLKANADLQTRYEQSLPLINKEIPEWSQEYADKLTTYGQEAFGASKDELRNIQLRHPRLVVAINKAYLYDQLLAKSRARTTGSASLPQTPAQPVQTVGARRAPASIEPKDSDNVDDWVRKERARMKKKYG